ncbi:MAG TPA: Ig-like domain-containing protein, partial [Kofleriaceae bacterium]|nr:Ig-like domain-containing protein [Kofleriaceae bacterium]
LLDTFGPGTPITGHPTSTITTPSEGQTLGVVVGASAGSKRGIAKVELLVNGFPWAETKGALFGPAGQANPAAYGLMIPPSLPDGISDFVARAYDDLGAFTDSQAVTRTKGQPCTSADTCARGQRCDAGKCLWDTPVGDVGDACEYSQFCKSLLCVGDTDKICSQRCHPDEADTCPGDLACVETGPETGVCYRESGGGCCSVSDDRAPWPQLAGSALVLAVMMRRRKRRRHA